MDQPTHSGARIGIDLGGTKIEGVLLDGDGQEIKKLRIAAPRGSTVATIDAIVSLVRELECATGMPTALIGIAIPGGVSKQTGRIHNANSTWLNGEDLAAKLDAAFAAVGPGRSIRIANDANCFALSEAIDGAAAGAATVFGVILGTGVGGGIVTHGHILDGPLGIAGEWGHNPLPWPDAHDDPRPVCWCGRSGCMESWVSGPAITADHQRRHGITLAAEHIAQAASASDHAAQETLKRHASRLARGLAHVVNIIDPDVIVLGGGLSKLEHLYAALPALIAPHIFADAPTVKIVPPMWGDASGVRGAAWLAGSSAVSVRR